mgnify:CR=1 FL=1
MLYSGKEVQIMYTTQVETATLPVSRWLSEYRFPARFRDACKACPDYGRVWSCPPGVPEAEAFFSPFSDVTLIAVRVIYSEETRRAAASPEETEQLRKRCYGTVKKQLLATQLALEKQFPGHGLEYATKLRDYTIALYKKCAEYALSRGIIIADTKFEFGLDEDGNVVLGDEMLTPDSSRFWPLEGYEPGHSQPSFDKQFVRDWLKANPDSNYDLPQDVIDKTIAKYLEAYELLTGKKL